MTFLSLLGQILVYWWHKAQDVCDKTLHGDLKQLLVFLLVQQILYHQIYCMISMRRIVTWIIFFYFNLFILSAPGLLTPFLCDVEIHDTTFWDNRLRLLGNVQPRFKNHRDHFPLSDMSTDVLTVTKWML